MMNSRTLQNGKRTNPAWDPRCSKEKHWARPFKGERVLKVIMDLQAQAGLSLYCLEHASEPLKPLTFCGPHRAGTTRYWVKIMDSQIRSGLEKILNTELNNTQWV